MQEMFYIFTSCFGNRPRRVCSRETTSHFVPEGRHVPLRTEKSPSAYASGRNCRNLYFFSDTYGATTMRRCKSDRRGRFGSSTHACLSRSSRVFQSSWYEASDSSNAATISETALDGFHSKVRPGGKIFLYRGRSFG